VELYNVIASWAGWPTVLAILLVAVGFGAWILQNRIALLQDKNEWQADQIDQLKLYSPDVLAQRLAERLRLVSQELERLNADHASSRETIQVKEGELREVTTQIDSLKDQLAKAQVLLHTVTQNALVCPHCGAPLEAREYHSELAEYEGREIDVDHEFVLYECGLTLLDGEVTANCKRTAPND